MAFITYSQSDSRWGSRNYNGSSTMSTAGCGPTACAMLAYGVDGKTTPLDTMKYMQEHDYAMYGNGTKWAGIPACLKAFGLEDVKAINVSSSMTEVWKYMKNGYVAVFLFTAGSKGGITWTSSGHYIAVTDYKTDSGKHKCYTRDSGGRNHTGWYTYETQMRGLISQVWVGCVPKPEPITKPTGKYSGDIPSKTLRKGDSNTDVKRWQKFLNWYCSESMTVDGKFGSITMKNTEVFQVTEDMDPDGVVGPKTRAKAETYHEAKDVTNNASKIAEMAKKLAHPKGTSSKVWKYSYSKWKKWSKWSQLGTARPTKAFMSAFDKYVSSHWDAGSKNYGYGGRVGASCDKFVGCVLRACKVVPGCPTTLEKMYDNGFDNMHKVDTGGKLSKLKDGDVVLYRKKSGGGHVLIIVVINGTKYAAEAGLNSKFGRLRKLTSNYKLSSYNIFRVWRAD